MDDTLPLMPPLSELPEAVRDIHDERRRRFVWQYVFNGARGSDAARAAGYVDNDNGAIRVRAHSLLQRDDVQEGIKALCSKYLFSLAPKAILRLDQLLDDPKHPKHDKAIEMALSRSGHGEKTQVDVNVAMQINHTDAALADLQKLKELGVSREKLIETFGFSGLERYEKMLPKVIEHKADE